MNKDAVLATIIGFGVGLVIAGLVFLGPTIFSGMPKITLPDMSFITRLFQKTQTTIKPTPTPKPDSELSIDSPLPESIEPKNETLVSGITYQNATVILEGELGEAVVTANGNGAYAGKLMLKEGKNELVVTSYAKEKMKSAQVTVYYTPEDF